MVNIQRVVILGANGTMGAGSAEVFAAGGCDVVLLARSTEKAREGLVGAQNMAKSLRIDAATCMAVPCTALLCI